MPFDFECEVQTNASIGDEVPSVLALAKGHAVEVAGVNETEGMKPYFEDKGVTLYQADCLETMRLIPDASIDACITDPPYGTTACSWDSVIPFAPMWAELKRIVKKNGAIVLFGSQPFTSALVMSNPQMFRYEVVWEKDSPVNPLVAPNRVMPRHENVLVFYRLQPVYNPQMEQRKHFRNNAPADFLTATKGAKVLSRKFSAMSEMMHPSSVVKMNRDPDRGLHPTQKPVDLLRYLVRTYTNEGDTVLDFTCGSGTTGVACVIEGRGFIGIEQDAHYCEVSAARIRRAQGVGGEIPKRIKQYAPTPLFEAVA